MTVSRRLSPAWSLALGFLLAGLAILTLTSASVWHGARVHDHASTIAAGSDHAGEPMQDDDADTPLHSVAHATGELVAVDARAAIPAAPRADRGGWLAMVTRISDGNDPSAPLRPPRA